MLVDGRFLRDVVQRCNSLRPDLVVITGDLVDAEVSALGPEMGPVFDLKSRWGTLFITGNHEYYSGAEEWVEFLRAGGMRVLMNERVAVGDGGLVPEASGPGLDIAGVPDYRGGRGLPGHRPDMPAALQGRDPERELLLLAHQPKHVDEAAEHDVGLQLSGHTHGGQLWPFGQLVRLVQPYVSGLHRHGEHTQIYVSRGTGFWGPPMRVAAPAEITSVILTV
jgi:predicted MPP superfamily phosphohydrolase